MASTSSMAGPENRVFDRLIAADLFRAATGQDDALVHDHDTVRVLEDDVHVVLDHHRRDLVRSHDRADDVHDGRLLSRAHAAGGLVEKEEPRLERVGDRHVEQFALPLRDSAGRSRRLALQAELAEDVERLLPDGVMEIGQRPEEARQPLAGKDGERHVVEDRQLVEEVDDLEAARDAGLDAAVHRLVGDIGAPKENLSAVGLDETADEIHEARLPRAVGADQRQDLALANVEFYLVDHVGLDYVLGLLLRLEEVHRETRLLARAQSSRMVPTIPVGRTFTKTTRMIPSSACQ